MLFAPKIRKDLLNALEQHILVALKGGEITQLLAGLPFYIEGAERKILREEPLPDNDGNPLQTIRYWSEEQMLASRGLYLMFVCDGFIHKKVGILDSHRQYLTLRNLPVPPGVQLLKLVAPVSVLYADFCARENGSFFDEKAPPNTKILTINFDNEITVMLSGFLDDGLMCSHRLQIHDQSLQQLAHIYWEEMGIKANSDSAQTLLLSIMNRLHYRLASTQPEVSNSCWLDPPSKTDGLQILSNTQQRHQLLCEKVIGYIQNNIHQQMSIKSIARRFGVSEYHLGKVFHQQYDVTLASYISDMRVEVAKKILRNTNERISEVAQLTGFASAESFSHVFRKHTGMSPKQYRNQK